MNNALYLRINRSVLLSLCALLSLPAVVYGDDLKPEQVYQKALPSIATLIVEKADGKPGIGNAFLGIKDGIGITAWHVVEGAKKVTAKFSNGEEFEVSGLIDKDTKRDVALVKIKVFGRSMLRLNPADPSVGSKVYVIGAPRGLEFSVSEGLLSQIQTLEGVKYYQFGCPASPGNSGGPLVNSSGEVLGVVSWQLREGQNLNFAVPTAYVLGLDSTLPTQPWVEVKKDTTVIPVTIQSDLTKADELLADSFITTVDFFTVASGINELLGKPVFTNKSDFWTGQVSKNWKLITPTYLFAQQNATRDNIQALQALVVDGPRLQFRDSLIQLLEKQSNVLEGLQEVIKLIQREEGWSSTSNDLVNKIYAMPVDAQGVSSQLDGVLNYKTFVDRLPKEIKISLDIIHDTDWFPLAIQSFARNPLCFLVVDNNGLGHKLGFKSGDIIVSINGKRPSDLLELKKIIKANLGNTVKVVVLREGKEKKLNIKIPKNVEQK